MRPNPELSKLKDVECRGSDAAKGLPGLFVQVNGREKIDRREVPC
jgi:hypothetical protein